jgi:hypothetical protein
MERITALTIVTLLALAGGQSKKDSGDEKLDFQKAELPAGWSIPNKNWRVEEGELRGEGGGALERSTVRGDFTLAFDAWTEEKANVEVKVHDAKTNEEIFTFAFLGRYHSVLDGVKSCILKGNNFANVNSKMWIFPGRTFRFEVRAVKGQYQMFLNGELGPFFADKEPIAADRDLRIQILISTEGKKDKIRIDNVSIAQKK